MKRLLSTLLFTVSLCAMDDSKLPDLAVTIDGKDILVRAADTEIKTPEATALEQAKQKLNEIIKESKPTNPSKATQTYNELYHINLKNCNGITPIGLAVIHGNAASLQYLLTRGASANTKNGDGFTLLHRAAILDKKKSAPAIIKILLEHGANLEDRDNDLQRTPLHEACRSGSNDAICSLIEAGALFDVLDKFDQVALHFAASNTDNPQATQTLLEAIEKKYSKVF